MLPVVVIMVETLYPEVIEPIFWVSVIAVQVMSHHLM